MSTQKKPVRRVRVIEVIDGDDLDDATLQAALDALDDEDAATPESAGPEPEPEPAKPRPELAEPVPAEPGGEAEAEGPAGEGSRRGLFRPGDRLVPGLAAAVVALAVVAIVALVQWRSAVAAQDARREVAARVTAFGDVVTTYPFQNVPGAQKDILVFLTGDALAEREGAKIDDLAKQLSANKVSLKSATHQVYVNEVTGSLASAVLVFDITATGPGGTQTIAKNHLTLGLVKRDGVWMISEYVAAGSEQKSDSPVPGLGTSPSPTPTPTK